MLTGITTERPMSVDLTDEEYDRLLGPSASATATPTEEASGSDEQEGAGRG